MPKSKRLLLLRHAKSSWDDPTLADHDRPLAPRGRKAAKLIGAHVRRERIRVSLVVCSPARRTRETLDLITAPGKVEIDQALYGASAEQLLERLRHLPERIDSVMLVGHNPAIRNLAVALLKDASELEGRKFPTGALATVTFVGRWDALAPGRTELAEFVTPRELG